MNFEKLSEYLNTLPGLGIPINQIGVTWRGRQVFYATAGSADAEGARPITEDSLYWIFSISKISTCTAAMKLVEEGRLSPEDPVSKYLPAFGSLTVRQKDGSVLSARNTMTVHHLLTMTAGLDYNLKTAPLNELKERNPNASTREVVDAIAASPLSFEPGTRYQYSLCHDVLAAIVETIVQKPYGDYLRELLWRPLGMENTGFFPNEEQQRRFCDLYTYQRDLLKTVRVETKNGFRVTPKFESGGAGLFSCASDQLRLMTALADGGYGILKPETIAMMQKDRLSAEVKPSFFGDRLFGYSWGYCGRVHVEPLLSLSRSPAGEFGWDGAAGAFAMIDTENRVAIYYATHVKNYGYLPLVVHPHLRNLVYEGLGL